MRLLFIGDIVGRAGREILLERLPQLRRDWKLDFVVVNGENASSGVGLTPDHARILLQAGADCITLGDHAFDQKDMLAFIETEPRILRPVNFSKVAPGKEWAAAIRPMTKNKEKKYFICCIKGSEKIKLMHTNKPAINHWNERARNICWY